MKKQIWKGASLLTLGTFIAKFIGAFYRIPLTNILGAEGMGVYQLIFPIYSLLLSTSSGALPVAISMLVSARLASGEEEKARKILHTAMSALLMTGVLIALGLVLLAGPLGRLQGSSQTKLGYIAIAPSVFFVAGIAVLRGWFQGIGNMAPSALSQVTEAFVKLGVGLTLAYVFLPKGIEMAVFGAMIGVSASELVTFIVMYAIYRKNNPPFKLSLNVKETRADYKEIMKISIPVTIGGMILPITQMIDSFLVVNLLSRAGSNFSTAVAAYGLFTGPVNSLINLPIVVGLSLGIAVVPQLSKGKEQRDLALIKNKADTATKLAFVTGVPFAFIYLTMATGLISFLYPALSAAEVGTASLLLKVGAVSVIILSVMQINTSILQGLGASMKAVRNMAIGAGVKVALDLALLPTVGIVGVSIASLASFAVTATLNTISVYGLMGWNKKFYKNSGVILLSGVIMGAVLYVINLFTTGAVIMIAVAVAGGVLYLFMLLVFKVFTESELNGLPFGKGLVKISKKLGRRHENRTM